MKTVLVVDDEESIRFFIRKVLEYDGYKVHDVSDAEQASAYLQSHSIDILITDIMLPGKDGFEFIDEVSSVFPNAHILAITGGGNRLFDKDMALAIAKRSGANRILEKPFKRKELIKTIRRMLHDESNI